MRTCGTLGDFKQHHVARLPLCHTASCGRECVCVFVERERERVCVCVCVCVCRESLCVCLQYREVWLQEGAVQEAGSEGVAES